jgi:hypothetical protein
MTIKYVKLDTWLSGKNKPNQTQSNPIQSQFAKTPKMNLNIYPTMLYSNKSAIRRKQNKPNQTQSNPTCSELVEPISKPTTVFLPVTQEIVGADKITLKIYPFGIDYSIVLKETFFDLWVR